MEDRREQQADAGLTVVIPALVRVAAMAWWRSAEWTMGASVRTGSRLVRAAASGESPADLLQSGGAEVRQYLRQLLGVRDGDEEREDDDGEDPGESHRATLRERGEELLRRSAEVGYDEEAHPAYDRILDQLAPDEGRILRLLAVEGPQPSVDVRTGWLPQNPASVLVAPGMNMIGAEAGCRHADKVHAYLNNLYRLGLVWFSRESVRDTMRYQVLEAQPEVQGAMKKVKRGPHTVRRSIHLTPFGHDFCDTCLPLHTAELDALPGEVPAQPDEATIDAQPGVDSGGAQPDGSTA
jgi:Abortive infection alpha